MLKRILNTEEGSYASPLTSDQLTRKIQELLEQKSGFYTGKFIGQQVFIAYDKLNVIGWSNPNLRRRSAYLQGEVTDSPNGSQIKLTVHPNALLPLVAIISVLVGVVLVAISLSKPALDLYPLVFGIVLVLAGLIYYPVSTYFRNRLRNRVVNSLDLNRI